MATTPVLVLPHPFPTPLQPSILPGTRGIHCNFQYILTLTHNIDSKLSGSDSSKALASILGGGTSTSGADAYKLASKPTYGFVPPSASTPVTPSGVKLASAPMFGFKPPAPMSEKKEQEEKKNEGESIPLVDPGVAS